MRSLINGTAGRSSGRLAIFVSLICKLLATKGSNRPYRSSSSRLRIVTPLSQASFSYGKAAGAGLMPEMSKASMACCCEKTSVLPSRLQPMLARKLNIASWT